jgi:MbtH protein
MQDRADENGGPRYRVVVNQEAQYALWPANREIPPGWRDVGREGDEAACRAYIEAVWTDMRPLSLRRRMDGDAGGAQTES